MAAYNAAMRKYNSCQSANASTMRDYQNEVTEVRNYESKRRTELAILQNDLKRVNGYIHTYQGVSHTVSDANKHRDDAPVTFP